jgi:hypothetical protein
MVLAQKGRRSQHRTGEIEMFPMMTLKIAELRLSEARDRAARMQAVREARRSQLTGTVRRQRRVLPGTLPGWLGRRRPIRPQLDHYRIVEDQ